MAKPATEILLRRAVFPNGAEHFRVFVDRHPIGGIELVGDGYRIFGGRKVIASLEDAARAVIQQRVRRLTAEVAILSRATLELPVNVDAVDPVGGSGTEGPRAPKDRA